MHSIINNNIDKIHALCRQHKVKELYTFGSINRTDFSEKSDVDFLVEFEAMEFGIYADTFFDLADQLEEILRKPVDLITIKSVKNPVFEKQLHAEKQMVYGY